MRSVHFSIILGCFVLPCCVWSRFVEWQTRSSPLNTSLDSESDENSASDDRSENNRLLTGNGTTKRHFAVVSGDEFPGRTRSLSTPKPHACCANSTKRHTSEPQTENSSSARLGKHEIQPNPLLVTFNLTAIRDDLKYFFTQVYPQGPLKSLVKYANISSGKKDSSYWYPVVIEGLSVLANVMSGQAREDSSKDKMSPVRAAIARSAFDSIIQLVRTIPEQGHELDKNPEMLNYLLPYFTTMLTQGTDRKGKFSNSEQPTLNGLIDSLGIDLNDSSGPNSLAHILEELVSKSAGSGHNQPSTSLQSQLISKIMENSPVAHLGALDDKIKNLVMTSLEGAILRAKNRGGSTNDVVQAAMSRFMGGEHRGQASNLASILPTIDTNRTDHPRRNVTHHSHLHKKFQQKYGKGASNVHSGSLLVVSLAVVVRWAI